MSVDQQSVSPGAKPHVIIVGAGIGGLTLALLLELAGVPYVILEKSSSIKPLGNERQFSMITRWPCFLKGYLLNRV